MSAPVLQVSGLTKRFGGLVASDGIDLRVNPGEIHAVIGPNGAGKTTLINQLCGELLPDAGSIRFLGHDVTRAPVHERALAGLARSYQITSLFAEFTALDNVALAVQAHRGHSFSAWSPAARQPELRDPARHALTQVGLADKMDLPIGELGHGEHRQLELAMSIAADPKLLLLDEPMAGMSQLESEAMVRLLAALKGRYPMLLVEHDMDAVFALADRITVLVYGRVIASDAPAAVRHNAEVRAAYLGDEEVAL